MGKYNFKYGKSKSPVEINDSHIVHTLVPKNTKSIEHIDSEVVKVLDNPIGCNSLKDIIKTGEKIAIIVSDITRAWIRSNEFMIHIVNYLSRLGVADEDIFIVIALGGHRKSTEEEKIALVGEEVFSRIKVYDHECEDENELVYIGETSRNTPIYLNKRVHEADRVILTGGIVFHGFAGFGGGAKSILPGVVGIETIQANHRLSFNPGRSTGMNLLSGPNKVKDNPVREDMIEACKIVNPDYLFNVVLDTDGNFIKLVAGDFVEAWLEGCKFVRELYGVPIENEADIIIASAGGYPKDMNLYQGTKASENGLYGGKEGSVLILACECEEGLGADEFADWFKYKTLENMENALKENFTVPGYVAYKTAYTANHRKFILISKLDKDLVKSFNIIPSNNLGEALDLAYELCKCENPKITLMHYGGNTLPICL